MARFIADAPPLKAAVDTNDPPTVQDIANRYQDQVKSNLLLVTNRAGSVLATVGASGAVRGHRLEPAGDSRRRWPGARRSACCRSRTACSSW